MSKQDLTTMTIPELRDKAPARLTVAEVLSIIRVSRATFYRMREDGEIPGAFKIGARLFIDRDKLLDWFEAQITPDDDKSPLDSVA